MSAAQPRHTRLPGLVLVVLGMVVMAAAWPTAAGARSAELRAPDPSGLSVLLSNEVVDGKTDAFIIAADDAPHKLAGVGAALGALGGQVPLLLTPAGRLSPAVAAEVDRIRTPATVALVIDDPGIAAALAQRGVTVNAIAGGTATELVAALADQTFGALGGVGQRLVVTGGDLRVAGLGAAFAANLGIPVLPLGAAHTGEVFLREVLVLADASTVPDAWVADQPGEPTITRIEVGDLDALGVALGERLAAEPRDGDLMERVGRSVIVLDRDEPDPHPALLAAVIAAADALDGLDATVRVLPRGVPPTGADGLPVTRIGLGATVAGAARPASSPLPATGGGLMAGAGLALVASAGRRR